MYTIAGCNGASPRMPHFKLIAEYACGRRPAGAIWHMVCQRRFLQGSLWWAVPRPAKSDPDRIFTLPSGPDATKLLHDTTQRSKQTRWTLTGCSMRCRTPRGAGCSTNSPSAMDRRCSNSMSGSSPGQQSSLTRQGLSRHLAVLEEAGLLRTEWRWRSKHHFLVRAPLRNAWKVWLGPLTTEKRTTGDNAHEDRADECSGR